MPNMHYGLILGRSSPAIVDSKSNDLAIADGHPRLSDNETAKLL